MQLVSFLFLIAKIAFTHEHYLMTAWLYGPLTAVASLLRTPFLPYPLPSVAISCTSFSTSKSHLILGLYLLLLPAGLFSKIFFAALSCSILIASPTHSNLFLSVFGTMSIRRLLLALSIPDYFIIFK